MDDSYVLNLKFISTTGSTKTISFSDAKSSQDMDDVVTLAQYLIDKKIIEYASGEELAGFESAHLELKQITPLNIDAGAPKTLPAV